MMFKCSLVVFNRCVLRVGLVGLRRLHFARPGGHTRWLVQTVEGADFRRPQTRTFPWPRATPPDATTAATRPTAIRRDRSNCPSDLTPLSRLPLAVFT